RSRFSRDPKWYCSTPHVNPARLRISRELASANPCSTMVSTAASMTRCRVSESAATSDGDRKPLISPYRAGVEQVGVGTVDVPLRPPFERLFQCDAPFHPGEGGTEAEVNAESERHVLVALAVHIEAVGVGELPWVASRCPRE